MNLPQDFGQTRQLFVEGAESEKRESEMENQAGDIAQEETLLPAAKIRPKELHHHLSDETALYSFPTSEIIRAAEKKWGANSRKVTGLYDLLSDMIEEAQGRKP